MPFVPPLEDTWAIRKCSRQCNAPTGCCYPPKANSTLPGRLQCCITRGYRLFPLLTYLNIHNCENIYNVNQCSSTLRTLIAGSPSGITDAGLAQAVGIVKLDVYNNPNVTTVAPFAATLRELKCSRKQRNYGCWVGSSCRHCQTRCLQQSECDDCCTVCCDTPRIECSEESSGIYGCWVGSSCGIVNLDVDRQSESDDCCTVCCDTP
jgi:hypothetical protein